MAKILGIMFGAATLFILTPALASFQEGENSERETASSRAVLNDRDDVAAELLRSEEKAVMPSDVKADVERK